MFDDAAQRKRELKQQELFDAAKTTLAENMKRLRKERGWSQERLADEAGLHRTYAGALEQEKQNVSLESLAKIAAALDVSIWELLEPHKSESNRD